MVNDCSEDLKNTVCLFYWDRNTLWREIRIFFKNKVWNTINHNFIAKVERILMTNLIENFRKTRTWYKGNFTQRTSYLKKVTG